jgi:hypothetical protein
MTSRMWRSPNGLPPIRAAPCNLHWLHGAFGAFDAGEAAWALRVLDDPRLVRRVQPTRDELVEIVERIMATSPLWDPEHEPDGLALLETHVPHPRAATLTCHPPDGANPDTWDTEAVVTHALSYHPIEL